MNAAQTVQTTDPVLSRIARVDFFAFGGVGFGGAISQGEKDFRVILARPTAQTDFEKLFAQGNLEAKCYALVALHKLNPDKFQTLAGALSGSKTDVATMLGCIRSRQSIASIIQAIESGRYV